MPPPLKRLVAPGGIAPPSPGSEPGILLLNEGASTEWSGRAESNRHAPAPEAGGLPITLRPGCDRRESNPLDGGHNPAACRSPSITTELVRSEGVEPSSAVCRTAALPLDELRANWWRPRVSNPLRVGYGPTAAPWLAAIELEVRIDSYRLVALARIELASADRESADLPLIDSANWWTHSDLNRELLRAGQR